MDGDGFEKVPEPGWYKPCGITLALVSGVFIGTSFIFKKKGLLDAKAKHGELGAGHAYLSSPLWWIGMVLMALGEFANFGAYAFVPAILVTPLGALSVVISAILSSIFLKERLNFSGKVGCAQCLVGAVIIVLHAPAGNATDTIPEFFYYVTAPGFITYCAMCTVAVLYLIYKVSPEYGDKNPIIYISICSTVGSFLVLSTQGFGSSLVYSFGHWDDDNQFRHWQIYPLMGFIVFTVMTQIHFLNKALNQFSTAIVTPVYYVFFTTMTLVSSAVLFRGFAVETLIGGTTLIMGFLVIVAGVSLLFQYSVASARKKERGGNDGGEDDDDVDGGHDGAIQMKQKKANANDGHGVKPRVVASNAMSPSDVVLDMIDPNAIPNSHSRSHTAPTPQQQPQKARTEVPRLQAAPVVQQHSRSTTPTPAPPPPKPVVTHAAPPRNRDFVAVPTQIEVDFDVSDDDDEGFANLGGAPEVATRMGEEDESPSGSMTELMEQRLGWNKKAPGKSWGR
ncbi:hypothetical protein HK101_010396 [Irineochytrium annulatum]|nr:hypothetical protein HK101_010396 [Irineochytrium annulatum]